MHHKFQFDCDTFLKFAHDSIKLREYSKLVFTKSIDEIFRNLIKFSKEVGLTRNDLEYVSIKNFINYYSNVDIERLRKILKKEINQNKKNSKLLSLIELPEFIANSKDIYLHELRSKLGNYITTKTTFGEIVLFNKIKNYNTLKNKIILLENADPGYDFIFSYNIRGIITEYGGSNSHMSIRCMELGVPAIIGIGPREFKSISSKNSVEINCKQKYYKILN